MTAQLGAWMTHAGETGDKKLKAEHHCVAERREGHGGPCLQLPGVSCPTSAAECHRVRSHREPRSESELQRFVRRK